MKLILKLIAGITAGILIGLSGVDPLIRALVTFTEVFGQWINFVIPLIILFFITSGIASIGKGSSKLVGATVGTAYLSTVLAGVGAFFIAVLIMPMVTRDRSAPEEGTAPEPFFTFELAPFMEILTALVLAFVFGIGIAALKSDGLKKVFDEGKNIIEIVIYKAVIPLLPFYIAGIFVDMAAEGTVLQTLQVFGIVLAVAVASHWVWITIQYTVAGLLSGRNPFALIKTMLPAYFTALGTMSSAATIPVTLRQAKQNNVREEVADFTVPLSATIHLAGSVITIVSCAVAVMSVMDGYSIPGFFTMLPVILALGVIMVAAPGVPGGAIFAALGVLTTMLGFSEAAMGMMIALYFAQDSFGTGANVTGDGAIAVIIDKIAEKRSLS
ncbi:dicarboxylate/amino acid:cation symporter [Alkalicoccus saliphilus]|jgi:Na+/H+-dicarboxylate symporter|uniref:Dicarboxylate/amino acid:cation symporter n=1 Tax=Alkalicoccus saliphilus TaxID=200989 RepID=A0A2T4U9V5_9BACI|nr:dicarboxylate/amino acid:cation symporter [Alkalicoccus saliphilus]PTL40172.1 dicarboxylate/amino acid:cation symporter [Alkalicoccus saliphilus]